MKISVWDTYVEREDGQIMHFDILVPSELTDEEKIYNYGKEFLSSKPFNVKKLTSEECRFCHVENASNKVVNSIEKQGFYIIEMENCH